MTPHKYPAVLSPSATEQIDRAVESMRAALTQAFVSAREWERQAGQLSATLNKERAAHDATQAELAAARARIAELESQLGEAQQGLYVAEERAGV